ncbi:MAG TPA: DUF3099 domain-containing protein [Actinomycetes bacterium]
MSVPRSEPVYRITGAPTPLSEDIKGRTRRYLVSMGVRTVCLLGAILVTGPFRWILIVAAVLLPYLAVVFANAGRAAGGNAPPLTVLHTNQNPLGTGPAAGPHVPPSSGPYASDPHRPD